MDFLKAADPYQYLSEFNRFTISGEARDVIDKVCKKSIDFDSICSDLKVCGRREFQELIKLRLHYLHTIESENRAANEKRRAEE